MRTVFALLVCAVGVAAPAWGAVPARPKKARPPVPLRPNIVFVLADQWRAQAFGFAGDPNVRTPFLDRLQSQSIQFRNALSGTPVCSPYRASLLTGQRPLTHGVFLNDVPLSTNALTLASVLRQAGYDTAYIGKWHLDGHGRSAYIPPERRHGFDYWRVLECTHSYTNSFYYGDAPARQKWQGYDAIAQTQDAADYIRYHARAPKPFFLFLAWGPPHDPYHTAPEQYRAMYSPDRIQLRPNVPAPMRESARKMLAGYYAHCTALDYCLRGLLGTLQACGIEEKTLVVFTSDHGDLLGSHGGRNKQQPYEESIRVPLLLRWPMGLGDYPRRLDAPINAEDIMPTLLGLCSIPVPPSVEGIDYSRYVGGGPDPSDGVAAISCVAPFGQWTRDKGGREYRGIRTERYTYVRDLTGPWLLFDNLRDPFQLDNLANRTEHRKLQGKLDRQLQEKLKKQRDEFLPATEYIRRWGYQVDASGTVPYTP